MVGNGGGPGLAWFGSGFGSGHWEKLEVPVASFFHALTFFFSRRPDGTRGQRPGGNYLQELEGGSARRSGYGKPQDGGRVGFGDVVDDRLGCRLWDTFLFCCVYNWKYRWLDRAMEVQYVPLHKVGTWLHSHLAIDRWVFRRQVGSGRYLRCKTSNNWRHNRRDHT
jgi:hypothetical protein